MSESDAYMIIIELVMLAKAGKPYQHLLPELKEAAIKYHGVNTLLCQMIEGLEAR